MGSLSSSPYDTILAYSFDCRSIINYSLSTGWCNKSELNWLHELTVYSKQHPYCDYAQKYVYMTGVRQIISDSGLSLTEERIVPLCMSTEHSGTVVHVGMSTVT